MAKIQTDIDLHTNPEIIDAIVEEQKTYFRTGETLDLNFRKTNLKKLETGLKKWSEPLYEALWIDLHKSYPEALLTETSIVLGEIRNHIRHFKKWAGKKSFSSPLKLFPSSSKVVSEPLGTALIVSPWNYPVQLLLNPLVGAISSGCTAVLKPSPYVPHVSKVIEDMIADTFDRKYIAVVPGHRDVNMKLLEKRWDLIFFTGSPALGKSVMEAASKYLTPVILELGGKSPCIVDAKADIKVAAKRIAWGKTLNSGQTCIAPDYLILHSDIKDEFLREFAAAIHELHGDDIKSSKHYVRMVNDRALERVISYIGQGEIMYGGRYDKAERFIEPTLVGNVPLDSSIMNEEIFGPVFPIIEMDDKNGKFADKVVEFVNSREKPLAFYYFGKKSEAWDVIRRTSSGGACINDTIMHIANENVPFGGVGNSGMGSYHGKLTFDAFSHRRSVIVTPTGVDLPFRYMPYKWLKVLKNIL